MFRASVLAFTHKGRELVFLGVTKCTGAGHSIRCKEFRAVSTGGAGGQLDNSRLLVRMSALTQSPGDYINDVVISPDGSALTAAVIRNGPGPNSTSILVIQFSAATGRQLRVVYRMRTGNGMMFYRFFGSDASGRYLLFNAGPTSGTVNGWIDHGRLIRLKPADGSNVFAEVW